MQAALDCVHVGVKSVTGRAREHNEDRVFANAGRCLFMVADGIGGCRAGEKASELAVESIADFVEDHLQVDPSASLSFGRTTWYTPKIRMAPVEPDNPAGQLIEQAVLHANEEILALAGAHSEFRGMGTTVVMALMFGDMAYITGVGDSRAHVIRGRRIQCLTRDHSLAQSLVEQGILPAEEAAHNRFRKVLIKFLGAKLTPNEVEVVAVPLQSGDRLLLSSDGLTNTVSETDIARIVTHAEDAQMACDLLVEHALDGGSRDDVSCVTVFITGEG